MEVDAVKPDAPISLEQLAEYWREKSECLEEWVRELLRKNQALRMDLEREQSPRGRHEEKTLTFSFRNVYQPPFSSTRLVFRGVSPEVAFVAGNGPCPRKECAEIREWVIQNALIKGSLGAANNEGLFI
jgi:hypothetical protein